MRRRCVRDGSRGRLSLAALPVALAIAIASLGCAELALTGLASPAEAASISTTSDCSWSFRFAADTANATYPETSTNYFIYQEGYAAVPGTELVIKGTYPHVRYFNFIVYQQDSYPQDWIYDSEIQPDAGSANPFVGPVAKHTPERYTLRVLFTARPAHPAPNTLYAGQSNNQALQSNIPTTPNAAGGLILRTFVPHDAASPQGSVPYPTVTWETTSGTVLRAGAACAGASPSTFGTIGAIAPENSRSSPVEPSSGSSTPITWVHTDSSGAGFPNQLVAYLKTTISRQDGDLVVVHAKAPTFPNTSEGVPAYSPSQLRYWSFCVYSETSKVNGCIPDYQAPLVHGYYTLVISDPSVRPNDATTKDGVAWLPWGSTDPEDQIFLRDLLPAPTFTQAAQNVPLSPGTDAYVPPANGAPSASQVMGPYYPAAVYCAPATFQAGGWKACFAAAGQ